MRTTEGIRLVDMNVWFGLDGRGIIKIGAYETRRQRAARFATLAAGLRNLDPDVIAVQEANPLPGYIHRLAAALGYDAVWKVANSGIKIFGCGLPLNFTAGNAVLAKKGCGLTLLATRRLSGRGIQYNYFSFHFRELRNAMAVRVVIDRRPLIIFNLQTHYSLPWNQKWKKTVDKLVCDGEISSREAAGISKQIRAGHERTEKDITRLQAFIKAVIKKYDSPYVVMGDFNTTTESPALQELVNGLGLMDAYRIKNPGRRGFTWDPHKNPNTARDGSEFWADGKTPKDIVSRLKAQFDSHTGRRIDFIFLSRHFASAAIRQADLVFNEPAGGRLASDHFGVQVVVNRVPA